MLISINKEVECWLPVRGYEGLYEVSNLGRTKSLKRVTPQNHHLKERIMKQQLNRTDYISITLCKDGIMKAHNVHRLVCDSFNHFGKDNKLDVNHINGNKKDNRLSNLEFVTKSENTLHAQRIGLAKRDGENNVNCKISKDDAIFIKENKITKQFTRKQLSEKYSLSVTHIGFIQTDKAWRNI